MENERYKTIYQHITAHPQYHITPPPLSAEGGNFQSQILKRGASEKNECLGGLKEFLPWIFAWRGLLCFLSKKDF